MDDINLDFPYTRVNHFKDYLDELQGFHPKSKKYESIVPIINEYFKNKSQMTVEDLYVFLRQSEYCRQKLMLIRNGSISSLITPKLLSLLNAPWKKYKYYEYSKLVLLSNRYDPNAVFYYIPVDIARMIAKYVLEIRQKPLENPLLELTQQQKTSIFNMYQKLSKTHNNLREEGLVRANFLPLPYVVQKLLVLHNINYNIIQRQTTQQKLEKLEEHFHILMNNLIE